MSRIIVLGATGRTGRHLVDLLTAQGDIAVAVFRDPAKAAAIAATGAETVVLDLARAQVGDLVGEMDGGDAVIFAAGTRENEDNVDEMDRDASIKSAEAASQLGIKRFIQISAMGVRTGLPEGLDDKMKAYFRAKREGDLSLMRSGLDWTILEPGGLTDEAATGHVHIADAIGAYGTITRADVAAVAVAALSDSATIGRAFELVSGDQTIAEALRNATGQRAQGPH